MWSAMLQPVVHRASKDCQLNRAKSNSAGMKARRSALSSSLPDVYNNVRGVGSTGRGTACCGEELFARSSSQGASFTQTGNHELRRLRTPLRAGRAAAQTDVKTEGDRRLAMPAKLELLPPATCDNPWLRSIDALRRAPSGPPRPQQNNAML